MAFARPAVVASASAAATMLTSCSEPSTSCSGWNTGDALVVLEA
ncbi:MAG: hypothetical protein SXG53_07615 [Pseudomonadota bacterium]|nr:hypothetical protein [Pseudomonadota bacterium]